MDWVELSGGTYESLAFSRTRETSKRREAFFLEVSTERRYIHAWKRY